MDKAGNGVGGRTRESCVEVKMSTIVVRRVAAIFLPDLPFELLTEVGKGVPLAVVEVEAELPSDDETQLGGVISSVNDAARRIGVRAGQTVADARARVANLVVRGVTKQALRLALGRVAEVMLAFAPTTSIDSGDASAPKDTVWIDLTGSAHLCGGEEAMLMEMASRARDLGHRARVAIADGPRLAKAVAVYGPIPETLVSASQGKEMLRGFPLDTLPLSRDRVVWLNRLGLWTVGDLTKLPSESLASRLGERWREALDLAMGRDGAPLVRYEPPSVPTEHATWDEPVESIEPLLFALRGMVSRLSARLEGRGEAAQSLELFSPYDSSIAKLRGIEGDPKPGLSFRIDLPSPLAHKNDLFRVLKSKLEHSELGAPVTGLTVSAALLTHAPKMQLCLGGDATTQIDPRAMAILLAELSAEMGPENLGVLELAPVHRPEARTHLVPIEDMSASPSAGSRATAPVVSSDVEFPTRLLAKPVLFEPMQGHGLTVSIDNQLFTVESTRHSMRLDQVEWWTSSPVCRDYARVWLTSGVRNVQAWVFTDRVTGRVFLHGYYD
jgi:protein ImuB